MERKSKIKITVKRIETPQEASLRPTIVVGMRPRAPLLRAWQSFILAGVLLFGISLPAVASYMPFNTNVNMNVGIGTSTPMGALAVMSGNVGIGTWVPGGALVVMGNVGIGTATAPAYNLDLVNGTSRSRPVRRIPATFAEGTTSAAVTINSNITDAAEITFGNGAGIVLTIANPSPSTPNDGDLLEIRVKDGGTAVTIGYGTLFASTTTTTPLTTVINTWLRILFEYNSATGLWECVASTLEIYS
jgi:hypothetical protein